MSEDPTPYGEPLSGPALVRKGALVAARLQTAIPLRHAFAARFGEAIVALADRSGRDVESLTIGEILAAQPPRASRSWVALGKIGDRWHALAAADHDRFVAIGNGRRRTLTPEQLAAAARFPTVHLARRAGRAAGFGRTFAHPVPL